MLISGRRPRTRVRMSPNAPYSVLEGSRGLSRSLTYSGYTSTTEESMRDGSGTLRCAAHAGSFADSQPLAPVCPEPPVTRSTSTSSDLTPSRCRHPRCRLSDQTTSKYRTTPSFPGRLTVLPCWHPAHPRTYLAHPPRRMRRSHWLERRIPASTARPPLRRDTLLVGSQARHQDCARHRLRPCRPCLRRRRLRHERHFTRHQVDTTSVTHTHRIGVSTRKTSTRTISSLFGAARRTTSVHRWQ